MQYIFDANNLAGKLGILDEENFDRLLSEMMSEYFEGKDIRVSLVFDSADPMGDKIKNGSIEIIYAPKDDHYNGADGKILEIIEDRFRDEASNDGLVLVTEDIDLKTKAENMAKDYDAEAILEIESCGDFVEKMNKKAEGVNDEYFMDKDELDEADKNDINQELMDEWN